MRTVLAAVSVRLLLLACADELTVEQQVIATLRNMEVAAEEGEHFEFMAHVAESFEGQQGAMSRLEFHRFMIYQINQNRRLRAQFFPIYVQDLGQGLASANFRILVTGGVGILPENGQIYDVKTEWVHNGSDWMLSGADWEAVHLPEP